METLTKEELIILARCFNNYISDEFSDDDTYAVEMYQKQMFVELKKFLSNQVECEKIYAATLKESEWTQQDLDEIKARADGWYQAFKDPDTNL